MNIKFKENKFKVDLKKRILKAVDTFMEDITRNAATPVSSYLFNIKDSPKLD